MKKGVKKIIIIGGGPAGLMAAQTLSSKGLREQVEVHVYDAMRTAGRKFLLAGIGGLNLTHSEPFDAFAARYGSREAHLKPMLESFGAAQIREWAKDLGVDTFTGTSGRVFPLEMKAAPLLRSWLRKLRDAGVQFHMQHQWTGWNKAGELTFDAPQGTVHAASSAVVLALGGASWPKLGSNGAWIERLKANGLASSDIAPLQSANCGFDVNVSDKLYWSEHFASRFAGQPVKTVAIHGPNVERRRGEFVITQTGVEGSLIYALSSQWRDDISKHGEAMFHLDLLPDFSLERVHKEIEHPRGSKSLSSHLKSRLGLDGVKAGLLYELLTKDHMLHSLQLATACKALPIRLARPRPVAEAISTAGGVRFEAMTNSLMLHAIPNVFCTGEMLDWEAPTGGYLLTACLASGRWAAEGVMKQIA